MPQSLPLPSPPYLLSPPTIDVGVPSLEADDGGASLGECEQKGVDLLLGGGGGAHKLRHPCQGLSTGSEGAKVNR